MHILYSREVKAQQCILIISNIDGGRILAILNSNNSWFLLEYTELKIYVWIHIEWIGRTKHSL